MRVIQHCLEQNYKPLMGAALLGEYEALLGRESLIATARLPLRDRAAVVEGFLAVCRWTTVYYSWRPNLRDEADNHLIELAVAGAAEAIVTRNKRDFQNSQLLFPALKILSPAECLKDYPCRS